MRGRCDIAWCARERYHSGEHDKAAGSAGFGMEVLRTVAFFAGLWVFISAPFWIIPLVMWCGVGK